MLGPGLLIFIGYLVALEVVFWFLGFYQAITFGIAGIVTGLTLLGGMLYNMHKQPD